MGVSAPRVSTRARWSNGPGDRYAAHDHGYDKVIVVERGSIRFGLGLGSGAVIELAEGDRLELPAGHAARRSRRADRRRMSRGAHACRVAFRGHPSSRRDMVTALVRGRGRLSACRRKTVGSDVAYP